MSARIITIEAYDPQWVERYKDEALKLREILAGVLTAIHHIGSTAVSYRQHSSTGTGSQTND